jgi:macrolide-specific efflux system membrane fusion protein
MNWKIFASKKVIAVAVIIVLLIIFAIWKRNNSQAENLKQITVTKGNIESKILSTGVVQPENRLEIKPPISGRIEQVLVDEGYVVKKGDVLAIMSSTERAALLDAARARGSEELKRWESYYKAAPILAPIDGTIILRNVQPGQTFTSADAILVMSDRLTIKAQVDETDIAQISLKQKTDVVLDAYPGQIMAAYVDKIAYDSKTINNVTTYIVDVLPEKIPPEMRSGMTANVSFAVASKQDVLLVPTNAVKNKEGRHFVTLSPVSQGEKPIEKEVDVGITDGKMVEIVSGLSDGDVVLAAQLKKTNGSAKQTSPFSPLAPPRRR